MEQGAGVLAHCDLPVDPAGQRDRLGRRVLRDEDRGRASVWQNY